MRAVEGVTLTEVACLLFFLAICAPYMYVIARSREAVTWQSPRKGGRFAASGYALAMTSVINFVIAQKQQCAVYSQDMDNTRSMLRSGFLWMPSLPPRLAQRWLCGPQHKHIVFAECTPQPDRREPAYPNNGRSLHTHHYVPIKPRSHSARDLQSPRSVPHPF